MSMFYRDEFIEVKSDGSFSATCQDGYGTAIRECKTLDEAKKFIDKIKGK